MEQSTKIAPHGNEHHGKMKAGKKKWKNYPCNGVCHGLVEELNRRVTDGTEYRGKEGNTPNWK